MDEESAGLRHRLAHEDPGHDGALGKVSSELRLARGDVLQGDEAAVGLELKHPVHEQERVAMREQPRDLVSVRHDAPGGSVLSGPCR